MAANIAPKSNLSGSAFPDTGITSRETSGTTALSTERGFSKQN